MAVFFGFLIMAMATSMVAEENAMSYPSLPRPVTSFGAVSNSDWLYVYGGHLGSTHEYSSPEVSGTCSRLNLHRPTSWEILPSGTPAQSPGLVIHQGWLYRLGGMAARNPKDAESDLHSHATVERLRVSDPATAWEPFLPLPEARSSHDATLVDGKIFMAGGWKLSGSMHGDDFHHTALLLDLSDPHPRWQSIPQPFQRRGLAVAALGERVFCIGGMTPEGELSLEVDIYDLTTHQWSKGPDLPPGKHKGFGSSACVVENHLYVSGMSGVVWRFNDTEDHWESYARLDTPRYFHRLLPGLNGQLLAIAGQGPKGKLKDIEIIPPSRE